MRSIISLIQAKWSKKTERILSRISSRISGRVMEAVSESWQEEVLPSLLRCNKLCKELWDAP
jgi:gas vesicle protein